MKSHGTFPGSTTDALNNFAAHLKQVLGHQSAPEPPPNVISDLFPSRRVDVKYRTGPFTDEEIERALHGLPANKACGSDNVPNEVLKLPLLRSWVKATLHAMQIAPSSDQKTSTVIPLPKKGDLQDLNNWRGISLMQHISKLFNRLQLERLRDSLDQFLLSEQAGFRPGRSTIHQIITLKMLIDDAKSFNGRGLAACYVDFCKAFDSISRWAVQAMLLSWHVPQQNVAEIMSVICGHKAVIRYAGATTDTPFEVTIGVLQGDTLAPYLFIGVLDAVLRKLVQHRGIQNPQDKHDILQLRCLAFADDIVLLASSVADLQSLLVTLESTALVVGLRVNFKKDKTEWFTEGISSCSKLVALDGREVCKAENYRIFAAGKTG